MSLARWSLRNSLAAASGLSWRASPNGYIWLVAEDAPKAGKSRPDFPFGVGMVHYSGHLGVWSEHTRSTCPTMESCFQVWHAPKRFFLEYSPSGHQRSIPSVTIWPVNMSFLHISNYWQSILVVFNVDSIFVFCRSHTDLKENCLSKKESQEVTELIQPSGSTYLVFFKVMRKSAFLIETNHQTVTFRPE